MKQTLCSLGVAGALLILLLMGYLELAQNGVIVASTQTLAAPHSPAAQVSAGNGLALSAWVGLNRNSCGNRATLDVRVGTVIYYCYEIRNNSTQTLNIHTLDAPVVGDLWRNAEVPVAPGSTLNPLLTYGLIFSRSLTAATRLIEPAVWTASNDTVVLTATAATTVNVIGPLNVGLTIGRTPACTTATNLQAPQNERLFYCITLDNTTGVTLTNHTISVSANRFQTNLIYVLPPSSRLVLTESLLPLLGINLSLGQTITRNLESTVTVNSQSTDGVQYSGAAKVSWQVGQTGIDLIKTISLRDSTACPPNLTAVNVAADTPIYYCLRLHNTGAVTLTNHSFSEPNAALGGAVINGQFNYTLGPGKTITLTRANITSTPGLVYSTVPVLGPFFQPVTATNTLVFTSTNSDSFRATDAATGTLRLAGPAYALAYAANSVDNSCFVATSAITLEPNARIWFCLVVRNIGPIELTEHAFQLFVSPPKKQGERYKYTAVGRFTHPLPSGSVMTLTNTFLATKGLGLLMGPYTLTIPLTNTDRITGTIILTSTNPTQNYRLVAQATNNMIRLVNYSSPTPTLTNTPANTPTFTPIPGLTPTPTPSVPPTPIPPTPTAILLSPLAQPTPTPDLRVRNVSAPASQNLNQSPLATPISPLATPTFPLDPALVAATQTTDAALTLTAIATLQPPTPTFTETPTATPLPTDTATPTDTPTATPTQRPIVPPTATAVTNYGILLPEALQSVAATAGWIWFLVGVLAFFIAAGIVAGLGLRQREQQRYQLDNSPPPPPPSVSQPLPRPKPEDDNWPTSLP